ncbi:hypothetical protein BJ973_004538 [Actinoplanes tereljensis]|uniref:non-specific serine/threonine protein kinase n=1 Tax=Paractinoplanes tereljensis TaxID=571912 RepID=A0A919NTE2_9ACTN|nr:serine/threonine-protein kinase [Actinoplanes tereljensis]GIF23925.1 protein kinase [Actinoplanes tereljensis]
MAFETVAGRYRVIGLIAKGGMGRVWHARDELLDREVAVKEVLTPTGLPWADQAEALANTVREARAAARLDHPNVVRIFDVVQADGRPWIVMEYVRSRSLHDAIVEGGPMTHRNAARVGLAVLAALRAAHSAGVLHRDVKPRNVLIAADGRIVLTDFGLATVSSDRIGQAEQLIGSPAYMAPERMRHGVSDERTDLWSLGATLYWAVEGRPVFARSSVGDLTTAVLAGVPDPVRHPGPLHEVIAGLLTVDPGDRLTTAEAETALQDLIHREVGVHAVPAQRRPADDNVRFQPARAPVDQARPPESGRPRHLLAAGIAAAIVAAAGVSAAAWAHDSSGRPVPPPATVTTVATGSCSGAAPQTLTSTAAQAPISLPEGWTWHRDAVGFALAVPLGWTRARAGALVCFADPTGARSFTVQAAGPLDGKPVRRWQDAERSVSLPGYRKVSMGPLLVPGGGADWEYSWQPPGAPRQHVHRLVLANGDAHSYALSWTTRDTDWQLDLAVERVFLAGFRDSARPAATWTIPAPPS